MPQGQNDQTVAYQKEKLLQQINILFHRDHYLFDKIQKKNVQVQSSRNMRIPLDVLAGGKSRQIDADGGDFGRGSALTSNFAQVSPVYFAHATEYTKLLEVASDSAEKAIEPAAKRNTKAAIDQFRKTIESLLNSDGSGTLDTIVALSAGDTVVEVSNPSQFYDNQDLNFYASVGGALTGTGTILSVDQISKTLTMTAALPAATSVGDIIVIDGGSGVAASSLLGIDYHQVDSNVGTWLQLNRAAYPGKLATPSVDLNNQALTPQKVRLALQLLKRRKGIDTPTVDNLQWHMNVEMRAAWENNSLNVAIINQQELGGNESEDMLKRSAPGKMADRPILESLNAKPGQINGLCLDHWGRGETQAIAPLEFGGQTMFPVYGASGGLSGATISYLWCGFNFFVDDPSAGVILSSVAIPSGY